MPSEEEAHARMTACTWSPQEVGVGVGVEVGVGVGVHLVAVALRHAEPLEHVHHAALADEHPLRVLVAR